MECHIIIWISDNIIVRLVCLKTGLLYRALYRQLLH